MALINNMHTLNLKTAARRFVTEMCGEAYVLAGLAQKGELFYSFIENCRNDVLKRSSWQQG